MPNGPRAWDKILKQRIKPLHWSPVVRITAQMMLLQYSVGHCGYHRHQTKLYVGSALVSAVYRRSSELGLYQTYTSAHLFDTLVTGLVLVCRDLYKCTCICYTACDWCNTEFVTLGSVTACVTPLTDRHALPWAAFLPLLTTSLVFKQTRCSAKQTRRKIAPLLSHLTELK